MVHVKGNTLTARRRWVEEKHGEDGLARLLEVVSEDTKTLLTGPILNGAWYPFEIFVDLNIEADKLFGTGDQRVVRELARFAAEANLKTIYKVFYKVGSVRWILDRAAKLWRMNYDSGEMLVHGREGQDVELEILGFATPHEVHCRAVLAWAEHAVELSGSTPTRAEIGQCRHRGDARCTLRVSWS